MIWLLQDLDLLSVILRALSLSLEVLAVGAVFFLWLVARPAIAPPHVSKAVGKFASWFALALVFVQALAAAQACATLMCNGVAFPKVATASFFEADCVLIAAALMLFFLLRFQERILWPIIASAVLVCASIALSHAASQLHHRVLLLGLTAAHHLGAAAWIGAMPFLLVAMRRSAEAKQAHALAARFSWMAIAGVAVLVLAGVGMSWFYVGSWQGLYGTSYGVMLLAKIYLLLLALTLGASNFFLVRSTRSNSAPVLARLRRFSEAEIGLVFTAILAAASMTAQPPARDMGAEQLTGHEIAQRMDWQWPTLRSPAFAQLTRRISIKAALQAEAFTGGTDNDAMDRAWSEYNHHWAGLVVLFAGLIAFIARFKNQSWARNWPLLFIALAAFIVLRADPETWPLGPRPFWASFAEPEVLQHRLFSVLIIVLAVFEWSIETGRLRSPRAALVFPLLCAVGGALLLTHMHGFGEDAKNETLVGMSHTAIAILGATAGWARWLQMRLPPGKASRRAAWVWPLCFVLIGLVLLDYREV
ncbi:MAG TPA: CopD family protein [Acidobacteriaceae bacterium]|nr:CopD family protein [Acidobacteriaceae bacterium]